MFSLIIKDDDVTLKFESETFNLEFAPQNPKALKDGVFNSQPTNGECYFREDAAEIIFNCAKFGCGQGGSLTVKIKMTSEIKASLENCIKVWENHLKKGWEESEEEE